MIPPRFEYLRPTSVEDALSLLRTHGDDARLLAGGHSLVPLLKLRLAAPRYLIDIGRLPALSYIREEAGTIRLGALTTHAEIEYSELLRVRLPLLPEVASRIGDVQVRNRGTIGGSLVHAHPAADLPAALLALAAEMVVQGPGGCRSVPAADFCVGMFTTVLRPDEMLVEIRIPPLPHGIGGAYLKAEDKASHFAVVGVAALVGAEPTGTCQFARVGVTGFAGVPFRATTVEAAILRKPLTEESVRVAAQGIADAGEPLSDLFASAAYRRHLTQVYVARALMQAASRALQ
ncbi:MAG: Carbon-monoxide dehydrogenase (acceptor) [Deltaproteobacteria bacterium]|nr:Carbon-monoxide dehydrogenase (acceptor) [Deltaproteobacteria bacterium]